MRDASWTEGTVCSQAPLNPVEIDQSRGPMDAHVELGATGTLCSFGTQWESSRCSRYSISPEGRVLTAPRSVTVTSELQNLVPSYFRVLAVCDAGW